MARQLDVRRAEDGEEVRGFTVQSGEYDPVCSGETALMPTSAKNFTRKALDAHRVNLTGTFSDVQKSVAVLGISVPEVKNGREDS